MPPPTAVDVSDYIDRAAPRLFHSIVFILCGLCVIMDGFDVQAMGYVAPALIREWHIPASTLALSSVPRWWEF